MKLDSLLTVIRTLNTRNVRFLVVGGVAVNLHGYTRVTRDLDLVVQLSSDNAEAAMHALAELGYHPQVPVGIEEFADADKRRHWIADKHMEVFSVVSERYPDTTVDLFVTEPFPFDDEYRAADLYEIAADITVPVARPQALIEMKRSAGRDRDFDDIEHLQWLLEQRNENGERDG